MQVDNELIVQRFNALSAANKLKVLLDQSSFKEFTKEKPIKSKFFDDRSEAANQKTLICVQILLNRTIQNLNNAEFPDVAVIYALANDERLFDKKVQRRIGKLDKKLFEFAEINLVQFATMSGYLPFASRVFAEVNQNDDFSVAKNLPNGKTYCHIAAMINQTDLLGFWIDQHVDPSRPDVNEQTPLNDAVTYHAIDAQNTLLRHFNPDHIPPVSTPTEENAMQENNEVKLDDTVAHPAPPIPRAPDFEELDHTASTEVENLLGLPGVENLLGLPGNVQDIFATEAPVATHAEPLDDLASQVNDVANDNHSNADFVPPAIPRSAVSPKQRRAASPVLDFAAPVAPSFVAAPLDRDDKGKDEQTAEDRERLAAHERKSMKPNTEPVQLSLLRRPVPSKKGAVSTAPNFDENQAGGRVVRKAGDEAVEAPAEGIHIDLTRVVSLAYREKDNANKPRNHKAPIYFEIFKYDVAAGRKLLGILAKLGIKDLIKKLDDKTLPIAGDDPTRVVVLAGNTARSSTFQPKERKGEKLVTRDFGYETFGDRIRNKPDVKRNLIDSEGRTMMHYAMLSSSFPMVRAIDEKCELLATEELAEKYTINKADKQGYTPVHYAAMVGKFNDLEIEVENKLRNWVQYDEVLLIDVDLPKHKMVALPRVRGVSALDPSVIIGFMNSKGANYGKRSIFGETPLQSAILNNSGGLIPELTRCSAQVLDINDIENGITGKKTTAKMSIVHYAAMHSQVTAETLRVIIEQCYPQPLLANGADPVYGCVNLQDADGNTPLHYAAATGNLQAMIVLMSYGADANLVNHAGKTPLQVASHVEAKAKGNNAALLVFSTDVPGVQNVMGRFGPDAGKQRLVTQEVINEFKEFVTQEILQGRLFNKVTKKLDEIFPVWYELVGPEAAPQNEAAVKSHKIYLLEDGSYMLRNPDNKIVQEFLPENLRLDREHLTDAMKSVRFKNLLLDYTTSKGHTLAEVNNTFSKQVGCYIDASLMLLIMLGGAKPELDSGSLHARKLVECEQELNRVTDPNFTKTFDKSKASAYAAIITDATKKSVKDFTVPDLPNDVAVASGQRLLLNYYSAGENTRLNRFFSRLIHPGRGHQESVQAYQTRLEQLPNDREGQLEAGTETLNRIAKDIRNNPFPHRRAAGSSALSRVAVVRELVDRSYTNGRNNEVPDLEPALSGDGAPKVEEFEFGGDASPRSTMK